MLAEKQKQLLDRRQRWLRAFAIVFTLLTTALLTGTLILAFVGCTASNAAEDALVFLASMAFTVVGLLITFYRPENRVGWILIIAGFGLATVSFTDFYVACYLSGQLSWPGGIYVAWFSHRFAGQLLVIPLFILLPFLFPTGHFLTPRWRWLCLGALSMAGLLTLVTAFAPDMRVDNGLGGTLPLNSPLAWRALPNAFYAQLFSLQGLIVISTSLAGIASLLLRLKRSSGVERQQMKWFTYFLATAVTVQLVFFELPFNILGEEQLATLPWFEWLYTIVLFIVFLGWPLIIGLTIFRYRLYDIDIIIRRTLVYSLVTLTLALVYFGSVVLLQRVFTGMTNQQSPLAIVLSTLLIAALFNPLRRRVQQVIDRRFYRQKYDAQQVMARFANTARDETDMELLTTELNQVVQETMQPEAVSIWLKR
jgi:hypothetical protein